MISRTCASARWSRDVRGRNYRSAPRDRSVKTRKQNTRPKGLNGPTRSEHPPFTKQGDCGRQRSEYHRIGWIAHPTITLGAQIEVSDNNFQFDLKDYDECAEVREPV